MEENKQNIFQSLSFPEGYFERARLSQKKYIEDNFDNFLLSKGRYCLHSKLYIIGDDIEKREGTVTGYYDARIFSDSIDDLYRIWKSTFFQSRYDDTYTHCILDMTERNVISIMSLCA